MPSSITHAYFALDVYDKLDVVYQNKIVNYLEYYKSFAQGPDPLFLYNALSLGKGKNVRQNYTKAIHNTKTREYFIKLVTYIKDNKLENNPEIMSFLYGFITHYALDTKTHPYIIYKTGIFDKNKPSTYKYNGLHNDMEVYIDSYMIFQRERIFPKDFKIHNFICNIDKFSNNLNNLLDNVFNSVYDFDNFSKIYYKSIKQMRTIYKLFRFDRFGIKKGIYKTIDFILPKSVLRMQALSYHVDPNSKKYYLNLEKEEWNHPMYEYEFYNYSFIELYRIALNDAVNIINSVNEVLYGKKSIKSLDKVFKNLSYLTGKDCNDDNICQYFEF